MVKRTACNDHNCRLEFELLLKLESELTVGVTRVDNAIPPALHPQKVHQCNNINIYIHTTTSRHKKVIKLEKWWNETLFVIWVKWI